MTDKTKKFIGDAVMNVELLCEIAPVLMEVKNTVLDGEEHVNPELYAAAVRKVKDELDKKAKT